MSPTAISVAKASTLAHAKQIYDAECVERSICEAWPEYFKPLTYVNVMKYFEMFKIIRNWWRA